MNILNGLSTSLFGTGAKPAEAANSSISTELIKELEDKLTKAKKIKQDLFSELENLKGEIQADRAVIKKEYAEFKKAKLQSIGDKKNKANELAVKLKQAHEDVEHTHRIYEETKNKPQTVAGPPVYSNVNETSFSSPAEPVSLAAPYAAPEQNAPAPNAPEQAPPPGPPSVTPPYNQADYYAEDLPSSSSATPPGPLQPGFPPGQPTGQQPMGKQLDMQGGATRRRQHHARRRQTQRR